jgi:hypothetical protein
MGMGEDGGKEFRSCRSYRMRGESDGVSGSGSEEGEKKTEILYSHRIPTVKACNE